MRFLAVLMLISCLNKPIDSDLFGPPLPSPWFIEHIQLEPFDLPPGVSISFNSEGYMEIKNNSSTILYMAGTSTQMLMTNSDESPIELPPGTGLLNKAVDGQAYEWVRYYDDVKQGYYSAWYLDDHDSIWLYSYGNQICSTNGCILNLAPLNHFGGNRPENVKIPEPQKALLPIIYGNEKIEIPIIISYTINTNYRSIDSGISEWTEQAKFIIIFCFVTFSATLLIIISFVVWIIRRPIKK